MLDGHDRRGDTQKNAFLILLCIAGLLILMILVFAWLT